MKTVQPILFAAICMVLASAAQAQTLYRRVQMAVSRFPIRHRRLRSPVQSRAAPHPR